MSLHIPLPFLRMSLHLALKDRNNNTHLIFALDCAIGNYHTRIRQRLLGSVIVKVEGKGGDIRRGGALRKGRVVLGCHFIQSPGEVPLFQLLLS